jgi:hypothetical protein
MEYFRELQPNLRHDSFLSLAFDWEGSGREILSHDQITATLLKNLQKALRRYVQRAISLISSKWAEKGIHPGAFASRMESAGEALEHEVFQMLSDGVSALAHGASTDSIEQALSGEVQTGIAREIELYRRKAKLVGLCELPEWDDIVAEYRATDEPGSPLLDGVSTAPLPALEQTDTAQADNGAARPDFPKRAAWLLKRLAERAWNRNDPLRHRGPDPKTIDKILRGETVREDVLEKLANALSKKHARVELLDIPQD